MFGAKTGGMSNGAGDRQCFRLSHAERDQVTPKGRDASKQQKRGSLLVADACPRSRRSHPRRGFLRADNSSVSALTTAEMRLADSPTGPETHRKWQSAITRLQTATTVCGHHPRRCVHRTYVHQGGGTPRCSVCLFQLDTAIPSVCCFPQRGAATDAEFFCAADSAPNFSSS